MIKRLLIIVITLVCTSPYQARAEKIQVTSQNLKSLLMAKNARVLSLKQEKAAAEEREGLLRRSFLPSLSLYGAQESLKVGSLNQKNQPVYGVEAKVNLFNGGQDKIESEIRHLEIQKIAYQEQRVQFEELEKAYSLYWHVQYLREKSKLLKFVMDLTKQNILSAQKRVRGGIATDLDRIDLELKETDLNREMTQANIDRESYIQRLKIVLGFSDDVFLLFDEVLDRHSDLEMILTKSLKQQDFLFKEFEIQADQQQLAGKALRREWWPKVDAYAAYNQYNQKIESAGPDASEDLRKDTVFGVKLTMSLSSGFESNREANALTYRGAALQALAGFQKLESEAVLRSDLLKLKFLYEQNNIAEKNIEKVERYYKLMTSEYSRGLRSSNDVSGAIERLFDQKHKILETTRDIQILKSTLMLKSDF